MKKFRITAEIDLFANLIVEGESKEDVKHKIINMSYEDILKLALEQKGISGRDILSVHAKEIENLEELVGKEAIFRPRSLSVDYWGGKDEASLAKKYKNKKCKVVEVAINEDNNKSDSYFDIQFEDGFVMVGVSGLEFSVRA